MVRAHGSSYARPRDPEPEIAKPARRRVCISGAKRAPARLLTILDQKADLAVDAKHRDLIVLDDDLGILDPKRTDAAQGLRCFANGLAAGLVEPVRRLRDDLDIPYDRHRPLLPVYSARAKHEREETCPASFGFASDEPDKGNTGPRAEPDLHESTLITRLSRERKPNPSA